MEETYQEVIDAYNLSSEKKQGMSLTDYIKRNNIKIKDIDTTPEKKAGGGMMRLNYAMGSEDEIPELEELPLEEFQDLLKSLGAPTDSKESGIRSLKNKTAGMGNVMKLFETPYGFDRGAFEDMLIQYDDSGAKGKGINLYEFAIDFLGMVKNQDRKAPSIKMAEYRPGDYDPLIVDEYEKYKFDAEEQGQPVMSIDEFLRMERAGVMGGGIMRNMYADGTPKLMGNPAVVEKIKNMREFRIANPDVEDVADYKGYYEKLKAQEDEIKRMLERDKKTREKRAKGGIAGVL